MADATVKKLLASFAGTTARATKRRQALIDKIAEELEFYPAVKEARGGQSLVNEAESEHKEIDSSRKRELATSGFQKTKRAVKKALRKTA